LFNIAFLYDLHFKRHGSWDRAKLRHAGVVDRTERNIKIFASACVDRFHHLSTLDALKSWLHFLFLPGLIFWATVGILFVNFGFLRIQIIFAFLSGTALVLNYWFLKEAFRRGKEVVDSDIFIILSMIKIYAGAIAYGSLLALVRRYCLPGSYLPLSVFSCTFLLIYQALVQHRKVNIRHILISLLIALAMGIISYGVLVFWGYNYFTAAIFMAACYNLFWGVFHYHLDHALTWSAFWEILIIGIIIASMVISVTNFKARILDDCRYTFFTDY
jgi:hypothetical protein